MIKKAKRDYYHRFFEANSGNSKEVWKSINELMSRNSKSASIPLLKIDNQEINNDADISKNFNKHFSEIGIKLTSNDFQTSKSHSDYLKTTNTILV